MGDWVVVVRGGDRSPKGVGGRGPIHCVPPSPLLMGNSLINVCTLNFNLINSKCKSFDFVEQKKKQNQFKILSTKNSFSPLLSKQQNFMLKRCILMQQFVFCVSAFIRSLRVTASSVDLPSCKPRCPIAGSTSALCLTISTQQLPLVSFKVMQSQNLYSYVNFFIISDKLPAAMAANKSRRWMINIYYVPFVIILDILLYWFMSF